MSKQKANQSVKRHCRNRPHEFDKEELRKLCAFMLTDDEIAGWYGCNVRTIERLRKKPEYSQLMAAAREEGKASLRRRMFAAAMNGSIPMMIFLSKNYLGMKDIVEQEHSMNPDKPFTLNISHPHAEQAERERQSKLRGLQQSIAVPEAGNSDISPAPVRIHRSIDENGKDDGLHSLDIGGGT